VLGYRCLGLPVRRLFSNFASGWPAVGLLLLRSVAGVSLIIEGITGLHAGQSPFPMVCGLLAVGDGALLVAGLWTPVAGFLTVALFIWEIVLRHENPYPGILLAAMGAAVAFVGPGAMSIDARLFGLKKIDIEKLKKPPRR
jgi:putative oxidoreductase